MHHIYQTEGIVISGLPSGEKSRKIYLFGRRVGLILGKVQAGRALESKLRNSVQDFAYGHYSLVRGKNEWKVVGAKAEGNIYEELKSDKEKIKIIANVLNLIKKLIEESEGGTHDLYDMVIEFILGLPKTEHEKIEVAERYILLRILKNLGFMRDTTDSLEKVAEDKTKSVKLINEALHAAEIKR